MKYLIVLLHRKERHLVIVDSLVCATLIQNMAIRTKTAYALYRLMDEHEHGFGCTLLAAGGEP